MPSTRIVLAAALLAALPSMASAGAVEGRIFLSRQAAAADSSGRRDVTAQLQAGVGDAVISLEPSPASVERRLARDRSRQTVAPRIDQESMQFIPRVLVVSTGDSVVFTNLDSLYHNVFSVSSAHQFDLGRMAPGKLDAVRFDHPGVINLHCELHPEMIGYIVVLAHRVYARPDSLGRFVLPDLPRGHYVLRAWHPGGGDTARAFDVPRRGATRVELSF